MDRPGENGDFVTRQFVIAAWTVIILIFGSVFVAGVGLGAALF
jgi:hypothetical protein